MALEGRIGREAADYVAEVVGVVGGLLGKRAVGAWLLGSAALGDFDPRRSDLDIQAVSTIFLARSELERLAAALTELPCPVRGLEFVLYAREGLADPAGPAFQLNLNTGPGMAEHVGLDPDAEPRFWFTIDAAIAREHGIRLAGPEAADVFPQLPRALVLEALRDAVEWYERHQPADLPLVAARARAWESEGRWLSKREAGGLAAS